MHFSADKAFLLNVEDWNVKRRKIPQASDRQKTTNNWASIFSQYTRFIDVQKTQTGFFQEKLWRNNNKPNKGRKQRNHQWRSQPRNFGGAKCLILGE